MLKILRLNPESEFDVKRMTKDQICEFIDEGCKKRNDLQFGISMKKARAVLPIMEQKPLCITERLYGEIRKDIPRELIETLHVPFCMKTGSKNMIARGTNFMEDGFTGS